MHLAQSQVNGAAVSPITEQQDEKVVPKQFQQHSSSLPFGQALPLSSIGGPTYLTPQTLIQQVAFTLSDKLFTFSPETFDLDVAAKHWQSEGGRNAFGYNPEVRSMDTRAGAGSFALGYMFSKDFDLSRRNHPQSIIAPSSTLGFLRPALEQLSLLYSVANPLVAHIAAVDYSSGLVTDYTAAMNLAEELGLALVSSSSAYESQHMSLLATLLASSVPAIHVYDGITVGRETTRVVDVLDQSGLKNTYSSILKAIYDTPKTPTVKSPTAVNILNAFNEELGTEYKPFEYHGHENPDSVLVVFGSVEASLASQVASAMAESGVRIGVINVRLYRPFIEEAFLEALPKSASHIAVLGQVRDEAAVADQTEHSLLYMDVLATVTFSSIVNLPEVVDVKYPREQTFTPKKMAEVFHRMAGSKPAATESLSLLRDNVTQYSFWSLDNSASVTAPIALGQLLSSESTSNVTVRTGHDNFVQGGAVRTDIRSSSKSIEAAYSVSAANVSFVGDEKLLGEFDIVNGTTTGGTLVVKLPGAKDEDLEKKLPVGLRKGIVAKELRLFVLDPTAVAKLAEDDSLEPYVTQLAFLKVAKGELGPKQLQKLASINGSTELLSGLVNELEQALREVKIPESWATIEPEVESITLPTDIKVNSFAVFEKIEPEPPALLRDWVIAAKGLSFKEAYATRDALRPDLGIQTCVAHVKEHRRLTSLTYDRNIFHIEFDLGNSGLQYKIGEALGIHAENEPEEVNEFIKWYGLNPDEIVEVPTREDPNVLENRTVYQALLQNVDIFGRPPKRFYEALSEFASDEKEKQNLLTLSTPEGAVEFKRRAEVDTITFADILLEYPSAHPSFNDIVRIVSPMKRREYSIASSQRVTPNSVSLLIVTVNWVDPRGRDRFGQATRYLNRLPVGAPVTVSVKPSVMKLPTNTKAPIIMAGLGTGLAPFRAFVQERALQKAEGHKIGAVMLYMGSRHQREEYLYGEEWEAYQDAGVITLLGRAFSRDQPYKVYIQDRMRQTMEDIRQAYLRDGGSFYLCGPTWPVPDVTEVLQEAYETEERSKGNVKRIDGRRAIETLKDEGRYVLEVY
ncbi:hypothetical protein NA57DRAFT_40102 [Rhizodiscina lignyota]|uniref:assimilatory sulfite reductase (NADPH) n=1 Tax=Rhizodiscina lignyota TaxID=1504668 RepID=A0A9P4IEE0_9PEZI|nr:hypothetical protein NA57DRAFT_40102 [Rhizodiscina lignyota]